MFAGLTDRAVFFPMRYPEGDWDVQNRIGAEDRWLRAADGVRVHSWWIAAKGSPLATVFVHGNAGNITHRALHARAITKAGSSVLLLDYRGYGKSEGHPSEAGVYADANAAYDSVIAAGYPPARIILHGESLGTAVAVDVAIRKKCGGVILEAPLESARKMAGAVLPLLGPLIARGFDTKSKIGHLSAPLLIIHGDRDEVVPYLQGQAVFNAAPEPKSFWTVHGAHHNDLLETAGPAYIERLRSFYATVAARPC